MLKTEGLACSQSCPNGPVALQPALAARLTLLYRPTSCKCEASFKRGPDCRGRTVIHLSQSTPARLASLQPTTSSAAKPRPVIMEALISGWRRVAPPAAAMLLTLAAAQPAHAISWQQALVGPLFDAVLSNEPAWLRSLVWNDFRLALIFFVTVPLVLWIWSLRAEQGKEDAIKRIMFGYWQAASLLMWTVYLQIGAQPLGFLTALAVQVVVPASLWWWKDLNKEVAQGSSRLRSVFVPWRLMTT
ncbi:hypothetical protein WJX84_001769, partial [Apatococcus fuscideae]